MTIYENAGEGVATPTHGAPIVALLGGNAFGDTTISPRARQEKFLIERFHVSPPVAGIIADLHFRGARR